jgi:hypothetical protein
MWSLALIKSFTDVAARPALIAGSSCRIPLAYDNRRLAFAAVAEGR